MNKYYDILENNVFDLEIENIVLKFTSFKYKSNKFSLR
jgi:hypothetical protein